MGGRTEIPCLRMDGQSGYSGRWKAAQHECQCQRRAERTGGQDRDRRLAPASAQPGLVSTRHGAESRRGGSQRTAAMWGMDWTNHCLGTGDLSGDRLWTRAACLADEGAGGASVTEVYARVETSGCVGSGFWSDVMAVVPACRSSRPGADGGKDGRASWN